MIPASYTIKVRYYMMETICPRHQHHHLRYTYYMCMTGLASAGYAPFDGLHLFAVIPPHAVWTVGEVFRKFHPFVFATSWVFRCQRFMKPRDILGRNGPRSGLRAVQYRNGPSLLSHVMRFFALRLHQLRVTINIIRIICLWVDYFS